MKQSQIYTPIATLILTTTLLGCGGSNSLDEIELPAPPSAPAEAAGPAVEFPVQSAAPTANVIEGTGAALMSEAGLSLYFFRNDEVGVSNCTGAEGDEPGGTDDPESCAGRWPPALAGDGAEESGNYTFVTRSDGTSQWAFKGYPLYTFAGDSAQGDINGDGVGGLWDLARPDPVKLQSFEDASRFVGNKTIWSATFNGDALEKFREDKDGFTLYIFDLDPLNEAACYDLADGGCINNWPPLLADAGAKPSGNFTVVELDNGEKQWALRGKPLYLFVNDAVAGETNGNGINEVWHTANQAPALYRTNEIGTLLTATGRTYTLLPTDESNASFEISWVNKDQFTLYTFDNDTDNTSNCEGNCIVNWPPFLANEYDVNYGKFTIFERADGQRQWAWNNKPLYFFAGDSEKAQVNGDNVGGVWHIITPTE